MNSILTRGLILIALCHKNCNIDRRAINEEIISVMEIKMVFQIKKKSLKFIGNNKTGGRKYDTHKTKEKEGDTSNGTSNELM